MVIPVIMASWTFNCIKVWGCSPNNNTMFRNSKNLLQFSFTTAWQSWLDTIKPIISLEVLPQSPKKFHWNYFPLMLDWLINWLWLWQWAWFCSIWWPETCCLPTNAACHTICLLCVPSLSLLLHRKYMLIDGKQLQYWL